MLTSIVARTLSNRFISTVFRLKLKKILIADFAVISASTPTARSKPSKSGNVSSKPGREKVRNSDQQELEVFLFNKTRSENAASNPATLLELSHYTNRVKELSHMIESAHDLSPSDFNLNKYKDETLVQIPYNEKLFKLLYSPKSVRNDIPVSPTSMKLLGRRYAWCLSDGTSFVKIVTASDMFDGLAMAQKEYLAIYSTLASKINQSNDENIGNDYEVETRETEADLPNNVSDVTSVLDNDGYEIIMSNVSKVGKKIVIKDFEEGSIQDLMHDYKPDDTDENEVLDYNSDNCQLFDIDLRLYNLISKAYYNHFSSLSSPYAQLKDFSGDDTDTCESFPADESLEGNYVGVAYLGIVSLCQVAKSRMKQIPPILWGKSVKEIEHFYDILTMINHCKNLDDNQLLNTIATTLAKLDVGIKNKANNAVGWSRQYKYSVAKKSDEADHLNGY